MKTLDLKSVDAIMVGAFKDAEVEPTMENQDASDFACDALRSEDDRELFGTDLSHYIDASFKLGMHLCLLAVDDPLNFDYTQAKKYIELARKQLTHARAEMRSERRLKVAK